jgi:hypothetical protein
VTTNPFAEWLTEVVADPIVVLPEDIIAEARGNLWTFGLDNGQRGAVTSASVEEFVRAVVAARGRWLAEHSAGPMRFYCWHDAQARQLRFSLVSAGNAALPFDCPVEAAADLCRIVREFLASAEVSPIPLPVWVATVPETLAAESNKGGER